MQRYKDREVLNLKMVMDANNITIVQLANAIGISDIDVEDKIYCRKEFTVGEVIKIQKLGFANVSIEYLFSKEPNIYDCNKTMKIIGESTDYGEVMIENDRYIKDIIFAHQLFGTKYKDLVFRDVFMFGYMAGKRAERKKKKNKSRSGSITLTNEDKAEIKKLSSNGEIALDDYIKCLTDILNNHSEN